MASGSLSMLKKNTLNCVTGFIKFGAATSQAVSTWKKIKDRTWHHAPTSVREQQEVWEDCYWKRHICQQKNMWVDKELDTVCTQKELASFMHYKQDMWRMAHWGGTLAVFGGWALPFWVFWFGNDTWVPSTFAANEAQLAEWRAAQDLYRYKYAPAMVADTRWYLEFHAKMPDKGGECWDELFEKNDVHRHPKNAYQLCAAYNQIFPFFRVRRKQIRAIGRAMGIPTYPTLGKICLQSRVRDYWELAWNEDYMVITKKLHEQMSDAELYDYAWRRYLAPYDKNLTRAQVMQRVIDYHTFLGDDFVQNGNTPNIFITITYCMGYYNDPAFLEGNISELDNDDFAHMAHWGKDAFMRRLEFENGPLRDQVEAHSLKKIAERQKLLSQE